METTDKTTKRPPDSEESGGLKQQFLVRLLEQGHLLLSDEVTCAKLVKVDTATNFGSTVISTVPHLLVATNRHGLCVNQRTNDLSGHIVDGQTDNLITAQIEADHRFRVERVGEVLLQSVGGRQSQLGNRRRREQNLDDLRTRSRSIEINLVQVVIQHVNLWQVRVDEIIRLELVAIAVAKDQVADFGEDTAIRAAKNFPAQIV